MSFWIPRHNSLSRGNLEERLVSRNEHRRRIARKPRIEARLQKYDVKGVRIVDVIGFE